MYFNARSILPKLDKLKVLAEDNNPDVICITESWLCQEISNVEVSIPGYLLYRHDRDHHGGGVLMYVKEYIQVRVLPPCPDLEVFLHYLCIMVATGFVGQFFTAPQAPQLKYSVRFLLVLIVFVSPSFLILFF